MNSVNKLFFAAGSTLIILTGGFFASEKFLGKKPTEHFVAPSVDEQSFDGPLEEARAAIEKDPKNLDARRALASLLFSKLSSTQREKDAERFDVLELLDTLSLILKDEPSDMGAMLMMGDLSFREQVYDKAALYYEKYLRNEPKDFQVKAKYGGALAYIGKNDKAIKELESVIKENPSYFPAKVYLGVAKVGVGKKQEALNLLKEAATQIGPESSAGVEIVGLIEKIQGHPQKIEEVTPRGNIPAGAEVQYETIEALLKANSILGPKVDGVKEVGDVLEIAVHDFPVTQMPEFARQKLLGRIGEFYASHQRSMSKVRFKDSESLNELATYHLPQG